MEKKDFIEYKLTDEQKKKVILATDVILHNQCILYEQNKAILRMLRKDS